MRRILAILFVSVLAACIIHGRILSNIVPKNDPPADDPKEPAASLYYSPFTGPAYHQPLLSLNPQYHYQGTSFITFPIAPEALLVRGKTVFRKGNTFFLFPRSFVLPLQPPKAPLTLPKN